MLLIKFTAKANEEEKRDKKNKYKTWLIDAKEILNISLDFFMPETGALMQRIEFRAKSVAKEKRDGSGCQKSFILARPPPLLLIMFRVKLKMFLAAKEEEERILRNTAHDQLQRKVGGGGGEEEEEEEEEQEEEGRRSKDVSI